MRYHSIYRPYNTGRYHLYTPDSDLTYKKPEFEYYRKINSLGLCEKELGTFSNTNYYKILGLGDSFTEGVGTVYDSTWLKSIEFHLNTEVDTHFVTINAGISSSDICYGWMLLKEKLIELEPKLVIFGINTSDIYDLITRGGMERFINSSSVTFKDPPSWEKLYAASYIVRHIAHEFLNYNWLLMKPDQFELAQSSAIVDINKILLGIVEYSKDHGFKVLFALHPFESEIINKGYYPRNFPEITKDLEDYSFDLLDYYLENNIINQHNSNEYYWEIDNHYKTKGYWEMGKIIAEKMDADGLMN